MTNKDLFQSIFAHNFDEGYTPDPGMSFEEKLANNNNWTLNEAKTYVREYKKFFYLLAVYGNGAPSDIIDQVWHQHILYTKDYAEFCMKYAKRYIHHQPDRNISASMASYDITSIHYEREFGSPPNEVWALKPANYKRVDLSHNYLVPADSMASAIKLLFTIITNKLNKI